MVNTTATPAKVVAAAKRDLGKPGPVDTCVSNGLQRFAAEAGAPKLTWNGRPTASITEARLAAKAGHDGWSYHEGLVGVQPGDMVDWARPAGIFHVSTVIEVRKNAGGTVLALRTIGSGGPSGLINWQPAAGDPAGWNVAAYWRGYWRMPFAAPAKVVTKSAAPAKARRSTIVGAHENLSVVAARTHVPLATLEHLNPQVKPPKFVVQPGQKLWLE